MTTDSRITRDTPASGGNTDTKDCGGVEERSPLSPGVDRRSRLFLVSVKARQPLQDAHIEVRAVKGKPGYYEALAYLRPHFQLEALSASMRLVAEVPKKG